MRLPYYRGTCSSASSVFLFLLPLLAAGTFIGLIILRTMAVHRRAIRGSVNTVRMNGLRPLRAGECACFTGDHVLPPVLVVHVADLVLARGLI